jgi:hypothetical protein
VQSNQAVSFQWKIIMPESTDGQDAEQLNVILKSFRWGK